MTGKASTPGAPDFPAAGVKTTRKRLADGTERVYRYHRDTGRRILGEPGSAAYAVSLREAARGLEPGEKLDLKWLVTRYQASPEWEVLAETTRRERRKYLDHAVTYFRGGMLAWFDNEEIIGSLYEWRDTMKATPGHADNHVAAVSSLFTWAKKRRHLRHNWAREIEHLRPPGDSRAELTWAPEQWTRLLEKAAEDERRLLWFARFSAARREDIARMPPAAYDGKWLVYKPQKTARKTGVVVQLPVYALPPFKALMDEIVALAGGADRLLLSSEGRPWTGSTIDTRMQLLKARAFPEGKPDRTFHDIRGTTVTDLYNAGCSDAEVASIDGHKIGRGSSLSRYAARSRELALNAFMRWRAAQWPDQAQNVVEFRGTA